MGCPKISQGMRGVGNGFGIPLQDSIRLDFYKVLGFQGLT